RRKKKAPPIKTRMPSTVVNATIGIVTELAPSIAQRVPSTNATAGLIEYRSRYFSGTRAAAYATGLANIHTWRMKGRACAKSRYFTFSADSQRLTPVAVNAANPTNSGSVTSLHVGATP